MAIAQQSELIAHIRGSIGNQTFRFRNGVQIVQRRSSPGTHNTPAARASKNNFSYNAGLIFRSPNESRTRLKFWADNIPKQWNNFWMGQLKELPGDALQEIPVPTADNDLELNLTIVKIPGVDQWRVEWTQRTREDEFVEFLTVYYQQNGNRTLTNRDAIPMNLGQANILAYSFIALVTTTVDSRSASARFGRIYALKRNINYNRKPNLE